MFASLPMFDLVELRPHTDALWSAWSDQLRSRGIAAPATLTRPDERLILHWRTPGLLASQTCGYPYAVGLRPALGLIGTFAYDLPEESEPGFYRSLLVRRSSDRRTSVAEFRGAHMAINNQDSLSGCVSFGMALAEAGVDQVGNVITTGAHVNSLTALQKGQVDLACIDALTYALLTDVRPSAVEGISIITRGPRIPCTPLISAHHDALRILRESLTHAINTLPTATTTALRVVGFAATNDDDYEATIPMGEVAKLTMPVHVD